MSRIGDSLRTEMNQDTIHMEESSEGFRGTRTLSSVSSDPFYLDSINRVSNDTEPRLKGWESAVDTIIRILFGK